MATTRYGRWADQEIAHAARRHHIAPAVLRGLIQVETGGNAGLTSSAGAKGLTQFIPSTARSYGVRFGTGRRAIKSQIRGAAKYLDALGYQNDKRRALGAYNGGPGNPQYGYAADVLAASKQFKGDFRGLSKGGGSTSGGGSGTTRGTLSSTRASVSMPKPRAGTVGLSQLLEEQLASRSLGGAPVSAPAEPSFSARQNLALPEGYGGPTGTTGGVAPVKLSVADQLRAIHDTTLGTSLPQARVNVDETQTQATGGKVRGKTAVVGDSLGVGTVPYLKQLVGGKVRADVKVGRSSRNAVRALRGMQGYDRVVFDAGTNDPNAQRFAKSIRKVDKLSGHVPVYVPIVHGPNARAKNAAARAVARGSKDVRLVRWNAPLSDGVHPGPGGYQQRAVRLAQVLRRDAPRGVPVGSGKLKGKPLDRSGVSTRPVVLKFAQKVAAVFGHPITLGTGTSHSKMTTSGNVSDHWSGHALDLPATGAKLTRMGQSALIAAGMSPRKAKRIHGGLFNVGGHQIIFNTTEGGNHYNHLHISAY